ncbi:MAG: hypothetical protein HYY62_05445 [Deltaproteobacteria bacterium]|nr:hypothetical protein [Deltaproteobacteria bacterium]
MMKNKKKDLTEVIAPLTTEIKALRTEMNSKIDDVHKKIDSRFNELKVHMDDRTHGIKILLEDIRSTIKAESDEETWQNDKIRDHDKRIIKIEDKVKFYR